MKSGQQLPRRLLTISSVRSRPRSLSDRKSQHASFGWKAKIAWVAFGVILDEIRTAASQKIVDHFFRQISPEILIRSEEPTCQFWMESQDSLGGLWSHTG